MCLRKGATGFDKLVGRCYVWGRGEGEALAMARETKRVFEESDDVKA